MKYNIYKRRLKHGTFFYVRFKNADGTYSQAINTGKKTRRDAMAYADFILAKNNKIPGDDVHFEVFADGFFMPGSDYVSLNRHLREDYLKNRQSVLINHIMPFFKNYRMGEINRVTIDDFKISLSSRGMSTSLLNRILRTLGIILNFAEDRGIMEKTPRIKSEKDKPYKPIDMLTEDEASQLFSIPWMTPASYSHPARPETAGRLGNLIASETGLRLGEIQGLLIGDIKFSDGFIDINKGWNNHLNKMNPTPKNGKSRLVPLTNKLAGELLSYLKNHHPDGMNQTAFLFPAEKTPGKPMEKKIFVRSLENALQKIGISPEERKRRGIHFHSWRYVANSRLINKGIPLPNIQAIIGHLSDRMTARYHIISKKDLQNIKRILDQETPALYDKTPVENELPGMMKDITPDKGSPENALSVHSGWFLICT